jgi:hypothetical protein
LKLLGTVNPDPRETLIHNEDTGTKQIKEPVMDAKPRMTTQQLKALLPISIAGGTQGPTNGMDTHAPPPPLYADTAADSRADRRAENDAINAAVTKALGDCKKGRANLFVITWRMYPNGAVPKPDGCGCGCGCAC